MRCYIHNDREAVGACTICGKFACEECNVELKEKSVCKACIQSKNNSGRQKKLSNSDIDNSEQRPAKSRLLLFILTFFFTPTGFNYLYLGLKKRSIFFIILSSIAHALVAFFALFIIKFYLIVTPHVIIPILFVVAAFDFSLRIAIFYDSLTIRTKMLDGIKVEDNLKFSPATFTIIKLAGLLIVSLTTLTFTLALTSKSTIFISPSFVIMLVACFLLLLPVAITVAGVPFLMFKFFTNWIRKHVSLQKPDDVSPNAPVEKAVEQQVAVQSTEDKNALLKEGKLIATQLNEKAQILRNTEIGSQVEEIVTITSKIFAFVDKNPEKARKLNKFINYYMPTAVQLLNNYEQLKEQDLQGQNISTSLEKIEQTMNNLAIAFKKQLDILFEEKAFDIDAEINVLNDLLKKEGFLED